MIDEKEIYGKESCVDDVIRTGNYDILRRDKGNGSFTTEAEGVDGGRIVATRLTGRADLRRPDTLHISYFGPLNKAGFGFFERFTFSGTSIRDSVVGVYNVGEEGDYYLKKYAGVSGIPTNIRRSPHGVSWAVKGVGGGVRLIQDVLGWAIREEFVTALHSGSSESVFTTTTTS
ncbi:MAG: hypothetical protein ABIG28_03240 [archaeon]